MLIGTGAGIAAGAGVHGIDKRFNISGYHGVKSAVNIPSKGDIEDIEPIGQGKFKINNWDGYPEGPKPTNTRTPCEIWRKSGGYCEQVIPNSKRTCSVYDVVE